MGSCLGKKTVDYALAQVGRSCGKDDVYSHEMDELDFYNTKKSGYANSCKIFVDNCVLHGCIDPSYDEDPEGAKWTALYMVNEPQNTSANEGAGCAQSVRYYQEMDAWYTDTSDFERGDEIYFRRNSAVSGNNPLGVYHTGIIVDWGDFDEGSGFKVVEGNTTYEGSSGMVGLKFYSYDDSRIAGAGRPRYDAWDIEDKPEPTPEPQPQPTPEPENPDEPKKYAVSVNSWLNVRSGPSKDYPAIWKLYDGDVVTIYEVQDGWGRIDDYGWVCMEYLT